MHNYRATVLVVDDEKSNTAIIKKILEQEAYRVFVANDGFEALVIARMQELDVILTDLRMPNMSGFELLKTIRQINSAIPVILITAFGTVEDAVEAMKLGAIDFLKKPLSRQNILRVVQDALKNKKYSRDETKDTILVGTSPPIMELKKTIRVVAPTKASIFIEGESGTGKEVIASMIHTESGVAGKLVSINCAAIPEALLESELFGHDKGAFTGAVNNKLGLFEIAHKGTIFLDEVAEMPLTIQSKLLRVLQDGTFFRLGGVEPKKVEVRIIAATNSKMEEEVKNGKFREDLWYRLNVIHLIVPPLRDRGDDILILVEYFLKKFTDKYKKEKLIFSDEALISLKDYFWPGNVRELLNIIERAVVLCNNSIITCDYLKLPKNSLKNENKFSEDMQFPVGVSLKEVESQVIKKTLEALDGDKALAAKVLGVNLRTIYRKINDGL